MTDDSGAAVGGSRLAIGPIPSRCLGRSDRRGSRKPHPGPDPSGNRRWRAARLSARDSPDPRDVRRRVQRLRPHERAAKPSRQHQAIGHEEQSTPPRERAQVDTHENLRPSEQLDTFADSRTERTIRLKLCRQSIGDAVIRIED
jgi:hypothetical protein